VTSLGRGTRGAENDKKSFFPSEKARWVGGNKVDPAAVLGNPTDGGLRS